MIAVGMLTMVCHRCGQDKPRREFHRIYGSRGGQWAQPCKACQAAVEATAGPATTAAALAARAKAICEDAGLDGPVSLLWELLECLVEDWGADLTDVAGGAAADWPDAASPPSPGSDDAPPPATPNQ